MNRFDVLSTLIDKRKFKNYLEIGVFNGHLFFKIKSDFKIAVDPKFAFDGLRKFGKSLLNWTNFSSHFIEKTSDDFFANDADKLLTNKKIDLAFIDGMHEYEYVLRDVENTLKYLDDDGVIVLHDCNPQTAASAGSYQSWVDKPIVVWNGDVWKIIVHLRSLRPDLSVFVLDTDHGLGVITKRLPTASALTFTKQQIDDFSYDDLAKNRTEWLNLKPKEYFYDFLEEK